MFRSLYSRLLALFLAILLIAMGTLTFFLYGRIREDKVNERLAELTNQARDVAQLAAQRSLYDTRSADQYMIWKSQEITKEYDAYLIIVDRYRNVIPIGDEIEHARNYLTIQKMRYKNKFSADISAEPGIDPRPRADKRRKSRFHRRRAVHRKRARSGRGVHPYQRTERRGELS